MSFSAALAANAFYRISNAAVLFLITVVLSRAMGAEGYGLLSLLVLNAALFNMLTSFGTDSGITYATAKNAENTNRVVGIAIVVAATQTVLLLIAEGICYSVTGSHLLLKTSDQSAWWMITLFLVGLSLQEKFGALLNGRHLYTTGNKVLFFCNLFALLVYALFFWLGKSKSVQIYFVLFVVSNALPALFLILLSKRRLGFSVDFRFTGQTLLLFLNYSFLVFVTNLVQFLAYRADLWIIAYYRNEAEVGWYSLAVRLVQLLWVLPVLFAGIVFPKVSSRQESYNHNDLLSFLRLLNAANIVGGACLFVLARPLLVLIFGRQYEYSVQAFQILLPGVILFCNTTILAAYFAGINKLKINFQGSLLCFASVVGLDFLLVPRNGYIGAAIASSIGYSLASFYSIWQYCAREKTSFLSLFLPQKTDVAQLRLLGKKIFSKSA